MFNSGCAHPQTYVQTFVEDQSRKFELGKFYADVWGGYFTKIYILENFSHTILWLDLRQGVSSHVPYVFPTLSTLLKGYIARYYTCSYCWCLYVCVLWEMTGKW